MNTAVSSLASPRVRALAASIALLAALVVQPLAAQAVKWKPPADAPRPPVTFDGFVPGVTPAAELREKLGEPLHEASWYAYKLVYAAQGRPGHLDAFHFNGRGANGTLGNIEAATVPEGLETWAKVRARLGPPEFYLELSRHAMADYSAKGLRIVFDARGNTIGVAYVPHGKARVHSGGRHFLSLRHLPQGPQAAPSALDLGGLKVGVAEVDVTPQKGEWLGPAAASEFSVHDPLKARCAVLERDGKRFAIVGADLFGMSKSEIDPIEASVREHGVEHVLLALSHNHAAADTIGIYGFYPKDYVEYIQKQIRDGIVAAVADLRPVSRWIAASDELPLDGARVEGLIRNARNPGIVDPQMAVMQAIGTDGRPIVTFVHFACHVEGLETGPLQAGADFPGTMCDVLAKEVGGQAIFLNGALGGMVSGDTLARTFEEAEKAGRRFAQEAKRILGFAVPPKTMRFEFERHRLELPLTNGKFILFMKMAGRRELHHGRVVTEMFALRLGDAEIITMPGELLPEVGFEIVEHMRGYPRMIVGLANDQLGYLVPGYDFDASQYEEGMSVGPAGGVMARDQAIRILEGWHEPARFEGPR